MWLKVRWKGQGLGYVTTKNLIVGVARTFFLDRTFDGSDQKIKKSTFSKFGILHSWCYFGSRSSQLWVSYGYGWWCVGKGGCGLFQPQYRNCIMMLVPSRKQFWISGILKNFRFAIFKKKKTLRAMLRLSLLVNTCIAWVLLRQHGTKLKKNSKPRKFQKILKFKTVF